MMSDQLPEGWVWVRIKDVISQISLTNRKLHQRDYLDGGSYPVVDQGQKLIGGYTDQDLLVPCELPVIVFGDHTKAIKFIDFPFVAGADGIKVIKPDKVFFAKLFYYFLFAIELPNKGYARHFQYLEKEFIPLPPLAEQERIVAKIEALFSQLDAGVAALRRIQAALKRYKASVLKAACEGRLVPQDPTDEPAEALLRRLGKAPLVDDDLPALPEGWCWTIVGDVGEVITGTTPPKKDLDNYGSFIPFVKPPELRDGPITEAQDNLSEKGAKKARILPKDSVLVSCIGIIGKTGVNRIPVAFNQQINGIVFGEMVEALFGFYYFQSRKAREWLNEQASATTVAIINKSKFSQAPIPLPPRQEQKRIIAEVEQRLSVAAEVEAVVAALLARSVRLRQAILKQAFEGKLV